MKKPLEEKPLRKKAEKILSEKPRKPKKISSGDAEPIGNFTGVRRALMDIADRKRSEEEVLRLNAELEPRAAKRTAKSGAAGKSLRKGVGERIRGEDEIRRTEREFRGIFELSSVGMAERDASTGQRLHVNQRICEMTGYSAEELLGGSKVRLTYPDDQQRDQEVRAPVLKGEANTWFIEKRYVRKNGEVIWVLVNGNLIRDSSGRPFRTVAVIHDITERKRTEAELRESEDRFRSLNETSPVGVGVSSAGGVLLYTNPAYEQILGYGHGELLGKKASDLYQNPEARTSWLKTLKGGDAARNVEVRLKRKDGIPIWVSINTSKICFGGKQAVMGTIQDISERKQAEEALRKSEARFKLLSETAWRLLETDNPQGIVNELCRNVMEHLDCQAFFNFLADEVAGRLHLNACAGIPEEEARKIEWLDYGVAVCGCVARDGFPIVAEDILHVPDVRTELVKSYGIQAYACHPLKVEGKLIGTLSFGTKTRSSFSSEDLALMRMVTDQVATAMERMRLMKEIQKSRAELENRVRERTDELLKSQQHFQKERQRFFNILETLPAYLILLTPDYRVAFANRFFRERFGESLGRRCFEYLFGRSEACENCETYTVVKTLAPHHWEWIGPDNHNYDIFDFPFTDSDGSQLIMEVGIDITLQRRTEAALRERTEELGISHRRLQQLSSQLLLAQEQERKRVAVELHDGLLSDLAATKYLLESKIMNLDRGQPVDPSAWRRIADLLGGAIKEGRRLMNNLHPSILDEMGLIATISWLCGEYQKAYPHIRVQKELAVSEGDIAVETKVVIYRVLQEALNNFARHGKGNRVEVSLYKSNGSFAFTIRDNGQGFEMGKIQKGLGLESMKERVEISGGIFQVESASGQGTMIRSIWHSS